MGLSVPIRGWVADHPRVHPVARLGFPAVTAGETGRDERGAIEEGMGAGTRRRTRCGDRGGRVRRRRRRGRRVVPVASGCGSALRALWAALRSLRPGRGTAALAGAGRRHDPGVHPGRRSTGRLPRSRRDGRCGAVGSSRRGPHESLRRPGRLARHPLLEVGGGRVDAGRLAHRRGGRCAGRRGRPSSPGSVRRVGADRDRRDLLSPRPPVSDGRRRPRHGPAGVGRHRA